MGRELLNRLEISRWPDTRDCFNLCFCFLLLFNTGRSPVCRFTICLPVNYGVTDKRTIGRWNARLSVVPQREGCNTFGCLIKYADEPAGCAGFIPSFALFSLHNGLLPTINITRASLLCLGGGAGSRRWRVEAVFISPREAGLSEK